MSGCDDADDVCVVANPLVQPLLRLFWHSCATLLAQGVDLPAGGTCAWLHSSEIWLLC